MRNAFTKIIVLLFLNVWIASTSCKRQGYMAPWEYAAGYIIAKESCNTDQSQDYWLIDLTVYSGTKQYGDTIQLNGVIYTNVVKTSDLLPKFKAVGKKVGFDFYLSDQQVPTSGCNVSSPTTYNLKVMDVVSMGEIR